MDTEELHQRGLALRKQMFGEASVQARVEAMGEFGAPLQHIINAYAYGDVWSRTALAPRERSIAMVAMMAALNQPAELKVHLKGALANGCGAEEIRDILLLVTLYCGIPAGNDAHRAAIEVLGAAAGA
jgi:4-carboxymuconolactone decarboxylase